MQRKINNMQPVFMLIIKRLRIKPLAIPLANNPTSIHLFAQLRLRIQTVLRYFIMPNYLILNNLINTRLQNRLQVLQLSPSTCLQVQAGLFKACKEKITVNQPINETLFAGLFVNNPNWK